jgi:hypothetical protein
MGNRVPEGEAVIELLSIVAMLNRIISKFGRYTYHDAHITAGCYGDVGHIYWLRVHKETGAIQMHNCLWWWEPYDGIDPERCGRVVPPLPSNAVFRIEESKP